MSEDGRLFTLDEIVAKSGGTLQAMMHRGVRVLKGTGVIWGGSMSPSSPMITANTMPSFGQPMVQAPMSAATRVEGSAIVESGAAKPTKDLLATDPKNDLLKTNVELR